MHSKRFRILMITLALTVAPVGMAFGQLRKVTDEEIAKINEALPETRPSKTEKAT